MLKNGLDNVVVENDTDNVAVVENNDNSVVEKSKSILKYKTIENTTGEQEVNCAGFIDVTRVANNNQGKRYRINFKKCFVNSNGDIYIKKYNSNVFLCQLNDLQHFEKVKIVREQNVLRGHLQVVADAKKQSVVFFNELICKVVVNKPMTFLQKIKSFIF